MVLFPSEASSLRPESAVLAGSGAWAGRHTGAVDGRAAPLDLLNVSRDTIPSTRDFLERHPSTSGARNAERRVAAALPDRRFDVPRRDGAVGAAEHARVGCDGGRAVDDRGAAVSAASADEPDPAPGRPGAA